MTEFVLIYVVAEYTCFLANSLQLIGLKHTAQYSTVQLNASMKSTAAILNQTCHLFTLLFFVV